MDCGSSRPTPTSRRIVDQPRRERRRAGHERPRRRRQRPDRRCAAGWDFDVDATTDRRQSGPRHACGRHDRGPLQRRDGVAGVASFPSAAGGWRGPKILAVKVLKRARLRHDRLARRRLALRGHDGTRRSLSLSLAFAGTSATLDNAIKSRPTRCTSSRPATGASTTTPRRRPPATPSAHRTRRTRSASRPRTPATRWPASRTSAVSTSTSLAACQPLSTVPTQDLRLRVTASRHRIAGRWTTNDAGQAPGRPSLEAATTLFSDQVSPEATRPDCAGRPLR